MFAPFPCKQTRLLATVAGQLAVAPKKQGHKNWNHHLTRATRYQQYSSVLKALPAAVQIVEVGPRDGLQNEALLVSTADKVTLITKLAAAGCSKIEVGSFVSPRVKNMANSIQVMEGLVNLRQEKGSQLVLSCLVPNLKYLEQAINAKVDEIAIFASASEAFSQKVR